MAKREWPLRKLCAHPGCKVVANYIYATQRDLINSHHEFLCTRHSKPGDVLSLENMKRETVMISKADGYELYWGGGGFQCGPGFRAWANDFPEGTRLIVTARIELPAMEDK